MPHNSLPRRAASLAIGDCLRAQAGIRPDHPAVSTSSKSACKSQPILGLGLSLVICMIFIPSSLSIPTDIGLRIASSIIE